MEPQLNDSTWLCSCGKAQIDSENMPDYNCWMCGETDWIREGEDSGMFLTPQQHEVVLQMAAIRKNMSLYKGVIPRVQVNFGGIYSLEAEAYIALRSVASDLANLTKQAYPFDILDPTALEDENFADTVMAILDAARAFMIVVNQILSGELGENSALALVASGVLDIFDEAPGKDCITSCGADIMRFMKNGVIKKQK